MKTAKPVELVTKKAEAAETARSLLGSSGKGGVEAFDSALAQIDLHLARLAELKTIKARDRS